MRWSEPAKTDALPTMGSAVELARLTGLVRSVSPPEFNGVVFHEVVTKSALNAVAPGSKMPFPWTINPYRGCTHACLYCFARTTHRYLDLNEGPDFDSQIIVKTNIVDVLRRELAKPRWERQWVALGTNTDCYQRAEGRYQFMPGIIDALATSGTPFSIVTKGTLLKRDLALLADAAKQVPISVSISIPVMDDALSEVVEPGVPNVTARLALAKALNESGIQTQIFLMPILPLLTDSAGALNLTMDKVKNVGVRSIMYSALHLRPGVREWYMAWLNRDYPELVARYERIYSAGAYADKRYRSWLSARVRETAQAFGLNLMNDDGYRAELVSPPKVSSRQRELSSTLF